MENKVKILERRLSASERLIIMTFTYKLKLFLQFDPCERLIEGWGLPYIVKKFVGER